MGVHRFGLRRLAGVAVATIVGATVAVAAAGTASADRPIEIVDPGEPFTDVNPCTGLDHEITINGVVRLHLHGEREVAHIATTGSTDSGYVMEHGVSSFVFNGHVARGTFTDNWVNPDDGSRFQARGAFVFNLNTEKLLVDTFSLRCIKG